MTESRDAYRPAEELFDPDDVTRASEEETTDASAIDSAADLQLMHGLLTTIADRDPARRRERFDRVLSAIDADRVTAPIARIGTRRLTVGVRWAVAAMILITIGFLIWPSGSTPSAYAEVDRILAAEDASMGRVYRITVELEEEPARRADQPGARDGRTPPVGGPTGRAEGPIGEPDHGEGRLYVKAGSQYVIDRPAPGGQRFIAGCNGKEAWIVPPIGPVRVWDDARFREDTAPDGRPKLPFINLKTGLEDLRKSFDLQQLDPQTLTPPSDAQSATLRDGAFLWSHLIATRRDGRGDRGRPAPGPGPAKMEVWYHPETGVIRRLIVSGMPHEVDALTEGAGGAPNGPPNGPRDGPPNGPPREGDRLGPGQLDGGRGNPPGRDDRAQQSFDRPPRPDGSDPRDGDSNQPPQFREGRPPFGPPGGRGFRDGPPQRDGFRGPPSDGRPDDRRFDGPDRRPDDFGPGPRGRMPRPVPKRVIFDLVDQRTLEDAFFEHASHHDADREVQLGTPQPMERPGPPDRPDRPLGPPRFDAPPRER